MVDTESVTISYMSLKTDLQYDETEVNPMRNDPYYRIPTRDYIGQRVKIGDPAIIFSPHGIAWEGKIVQIGRKRWFAVDEGMRIGGIGNMMLMKG